MVRIFSLFIKHIFLKAKHRLNRLILAIQFYLHILLKTKKIIQYFYKLHDTFLTVKWSKFNLDESTDLLADFHPLINLPEQAYKTLVWQPSVFAAPRKNKIIESIYLYFNAVGGYGKNKAMQQFYAPVALADTHYLSECHQQDVMALYNTMAFAEYRSYKIFRQNPIRQKYVADKKNSYRVSLLYFFSNPESDFVSNEYSTLLNFDTIINCHKFLLYVLVYSRSSKVISYKFSILQLLNYVCGKVVLSDNVLKITKFLYKTRGSFLYKSKFFNTLNIFMDPRAFSNHSFSQRYIVEQQYYLAVFDHINTLQVYLQRFGLKQSFLFNYLNTYYGIVNTRDTPVFVPLGFVDKLKYTSFGVGYSPFALLSVDSYSILHGFYYKNFFNPYFRFFLKSTFVYSVNSDKNIFSDIYSRSIFYYGDSSKIVSRLRLVFLNRIHLLYSTLRRSRSRSIEFDEKLYATFFLDKVLDLNNSFSWQSTQFLKMFNNVRKTNDRSYNLKNYYNRSLLGPYEELGFSRSLNHYFKSLYFNYFCMVYSEEPMFWEYFFDLEEEQYDEDEEDDEDDEDENDELDDDEEIFDPAEEMDEGDRYFDDFEMPLLATSTSMQIVVGLHILTTEAFISEGEGDISDYAIMDDVVDYTDPGVYLIQKPYKLLVELFGSIAINTVNLLFQVLQQIRYKFNVIGSDVRHGDYHLWKNIRYTLIFPCLLLSTFSLLTIFFVYNFFYLYEILGYTQFLEPVLFLVVFSLFLSTFYIIFVIRSHERAQIILQLLFQTSLFLSSLMIGLLAKRYWPYVMLANDDIENDQAYDFGDFIPLNFPIGITYRSTQKDSLQLSEYPLVDYHIIGKEYQNPGHKFTLLRRLSGDLSLKQHYLYSLKPIRKKKEPLPNVRNWFSVWRKRFLKSKRELPSDKSDMKKFKPDWRKSQKAGLIIEGRKGRKKWWNGYGWYNEYNFRGNEKFFPIKRKKLVKPTWYSNFNISLSELIHNYIDYRNQEFFIPYKKRRTSIMGNMLYKNENFHFWGFFDSRWFQAIDYGTYFNDIRFRGAAIQNSLNSYFFDWFNYLPLNAYNVSQKPNIPAMTFRKQQFTHNVNFIASKWSRPRYPKWALRIPEVKINKFPKGRLRRTYRKRNKLFAQGYYDYKESTFHPLDFYIPDQLKALRAVTKSPEKNEDIPHRYRILIKKRRKAKTRVQYAELDRKRGKVNLKFRSKSEGFKFKTRHGFYDLDRLMMYTVPLNRWYRHGKNPRSYAKKRYVFRESNQLGALFTRPKRFLTVIRDKYERKQPKIRRKFIHQTFITQRSSTSRKGEDFPRFLPWSVDGRVSVIRYSDLHRCIAIRQTARRKQFYNYAFGKLARLSFFESFRHLRRFKLKNHHRLKKQLISKYLTSYKTKRYSHLNQIVKSDILTYPLVEPNALYKINKLDTRYLSFSFYSNQSLWPMGKESGLHNDEFLGLNLGAPMPRFRAWTTRYKKPMKVGAIIKRSRVKLRRDMFTWKTNYRQERVLYSYKAKFRHYLKYRLDYRPMSRKYHLFPQPAPFIMYKPHRPWWSILPNNFRESSYFSYNGQNTMNLWGSSAYSKYSFEQTFIGRLYFIYLNILTTLNFARPMQSKVWYVGDHVDIMDYRKNALSRQEHHWLYRSNLRPFEFQFFNGTERKETLNIQRLYNQNYFKRTRTIHIFYDRSIHLNQPRREHNVKHLNHIVKAKIPHIGKNVKINIQYKGPIKKINDWRKGQPKRGMAYRLRDKLRRIEKLEFRRYFRKTIGQVKKVPPQGQREIIGDINAHLFTRNHILYKPTSLKKRIRRLRYIADTYPELLIKHFTNRHRLFKIRRKWIRKRILRYRTNKKLSLADRVLAWRRIFLMPKDYQKSSQRKISYKRKLSQIFQYDAHRNYNLKPVFGQPKRIQIIIPKRFRLWNYHRNTSAKNFLFLNFYYSPAHLTQPSTTYFKDYKGHYILHGQKFPRINTYRKKYLRFRFWLDRSTAVTQRKYYYNMNYSASNLISFGRYDPWNSLVMDTYNDYFMLNNYGYRTSYNMLLKIANNLNQILINDFVNRVSFFVTNSLIYTSYYLFGLPDPWPFFGIY